MCVFSKPKVAKAPPPAPVAPPPPVNPNERIQEVPDTRFTDPKARKRRSNALGSLRIERVSQGLPIAGGVNVLK